MKSIRVIGRDTGLRKPHKPVVYRHISVDPCGDGWTIGIEGDNNIYYSQEIAFNAIDLALGGKTRKDASRRHAFGIRIIGQKEAE